MLLKKYTVGCFRPASAWRPGYCPGADRNASPEPGACKSCRSYCKKPMIVASRRQCAAPEFITMAERLPARSSFHGVTAETGLDALTHAVEAYIGRFYNTRETRSLTRQVVEAIYRMNRALGIPERFPCIRPEDLPQMAV